jgi:lipopolysaccharide transport system ATP-binding protein
MPAILAENISKKYVLNHKDENAPTNFKEAIFSLFAKKSKNTEATKTKEIFWALKDVDFEIKQGDRVGIIGSNGAGKSTLLKILSRITEPTTGSVKIKGRVASLLEVGTGFHAELSGRENIFLNGAILGMKKAEIQKNFDEIVAFSGVEKFLDTPVKRYSSGMYVRLGFSIAAHLEPDIMIVDEVLAVGDAEFQKKCLGKMKDVSAEGRTILFVSHNLTAVDSLCNNAIFLNKGSVYDQGDVKKVIGSYLKNYSKNNLEQSWYNNPEAPGNGEVKFRHIKVQPQLLPNQLSMDVRNPIQISIEFESFLKNASLNLSLFVLSLTGECVFNIGSEIVTENEGIYKGICEIPAPLLNDGSYTLSIMIVKDTTNILYYLEEPLNFEVADWRAGDGNWYGKWPGVIRPSLPFTLNKIS